MGLTVICPESKKHRAALSKALQYIGLNDYQLLDPAHDEIGREFCYILYVGILPEERFKTLKDLSQQAWVIPPPDPTANVDEKKKWLESVKEIQTFILTNKDKENFKRTDIPNIKNLQEYLNSKKGQIIETTLPDRRKLGIYPDSQKLKGFYDIEYHASTIVNIAKLFHLFDASEIIIKEL